MNIECQVIVNSSPCHTMLSCGVIAAWEELKAQKLVAMMEAAIQRRFPAGVKLHVHASDCFSCLPELTLHHSQLSTT